mgnify:CR=1 FL=1
MKMIHSALAKPPRWCDGRKALDRGGLHPIASGQGHPGAVAIHQRDAVLWGGRLRPDEAVEVPEGRHVHLFVALGSAALGFLLA